MVTEFCTVKNLVFVSRFPSMTEFLYIELLSVYEGAAFSQLSLAEVVAERTHPVRNKVSTSVGVVKALIK